jgi:hypothetical protein
MSREERKAKILDACAAGRAEKVRSLCLGVENFNFKQLLGGEPLIVASEKGHLAVVRVLCELGERYGTRFRTINMVRSPHRGWAALHFASEKGHAEIVRLLAQSGAKLNAATKNGSTPAYLAAQNDHANVVRALGELGADLSAAERIHGLTPLHVASSWGLSAVVQALAELGAEVNALDHLGEPALALALRSTEANENKIYEIVKTLCVRGALRDFPEGDAEEYAEAVRGVRSRTRVRRFLKRTRGLVHPLQYSSELTLEEATAWLRSETLRDFPPIDFLNKGTETCNLITMALKSWSWERARFFPDSCNRRARDLDIVLRCKKKGPPKVVIEMILAFAIDRHGGL